VVEPDSNNSKYGAPGEVQSAPRKEWNTVATIQMKMQMIDPLDEDEAREFTECKVIDENGSSMKAVNQSDREWVSDGSKYASRSIPRCKKQLVVWERARRGSSQELLRTQKEAKARNREDQIKRDWTKLCPKKNSGTRHQTEHQRKDAQIGVTSRLFSSSSNSAFRFSIGKFQRSYPLALMLKLMILPIRKSEMLY